MCSVCGCAGSGARIEGAGEAGAAGLRARGRDDGHARSHDGAEGTLDFGAGPARAHAPGLSPARMIEIETGILARNDAFAEDNRARFAEAGTLALNLVSSPGSGKTTLLVATIEAIAGAFPVAVVEGDQRTSNDAERIRATGVPAVQVNTGRGCHLDAHMVGHAIERLPLAPFGALFIENVGNLVCPAAFDLGEKAKVAILSVTEGEDKPLKYPDVFAASALVVVNKIDLAGPCGTDLDLLEKNARRVNPFVEIIRLSARTGEGMDAWLGWLSDRRDAVVQRTRAREAEAAHAG